MRLSNLPRGTRVTTRLISPSFETLDGASFAAQFKQIFASQAFVVANQCRPMRIIDCGANVGVFTVFCRRQYPDSHITAFEPDPVVFAMLSRNVDACCGRSGIDLVQAAVTHDDSQEKTFYADHCDAGRLEVSLPGVASQLVRCIRLRDVLQEGCDLLKIDVEGAEVDILSDCVDLLPQVTNIFVEYHSFAGRDQRLFQLLHTLEQGGFRVHIHCGKTSRQPFLRMETFLGMDMQLDIWGVRETSQL